MAGSSSDNSRVPLIPKLLAAFILGLVLMILAVVVVECRREPPPVEKVPVGPGIQPVIPNREAPDTEGDG